MQGDGIDTDSDGFSEFSDSSDAKYKSTKQVSFKEASPPKEAAATTADAKLISKAFENQKRLIDQRASPKAVAKEPDTVVQ